MSMIIVPNEYKEEKPFVYYSLFLWHNSKTYADEKHEYLNCSDAIGTLKNRIEHDSEIIEMATIREETIYRRTENTEISVSSPLLHYDHETGYRI